MPLLEVRGLTKQFGGLTAVNAVDLVLDAGSITSVIGPNGAGKTTFFNMVTGLYTPTSGTITFNGERMNGKRPNAITARGIGRTFQNIRLFHNMTALENVMVGMNARLKQHWWDALLRTPSMLAEERAAAARGRELMDFVGLNGVYKVVAKNLPYGLQRRLEVARALATEPKLILLDEPTAGMNPNETADMTRLMRRLRDELGLTVLLIEHDMKVVMGISERITVLDYGQRIAEGSPADIRANPRVIEAYLGRRAVAAS